jgi:hypothetical protein
MPTCSGNPIKPLTEPRGKHKTGIARNRSEREGGTPTRRLRHVRSLSGACKPARAPSDNGQVVSLSVSRRFSPLPCRRACIAEAADAPAPKRLIFRVASLSSPCFPTSTAPSSRGLGHQILNLGTRVRIPLGPPNLYEGSFPAVTS